MVPDAVQWRNVRLGCVGAVVPVVGVDDLDPRDAERVEVGARVAGHPVGSPSSGSDSGSSRSPKKRSRSCGEDFVLADEASLVADVEDVDQAGSVGWHGVGVAAEAVEEISNRRHAGKATPVLSSVGMMGYSSATALIN